MAKFKVGETVFTTGTNLPCVIKSIRENKGHTWYVLEDGTTSHERYLWDGVPDKIVYCSQLICQREIDTTKEVEGVNFVRDEYGFRMCKSHENNEWNEDFHNAFKKNG